MASVTFKVAGLRELGEAMRTLSDDVNKKIARAATNAGAQVIKKLAISKAPIAPLFVSPDVPFGNLKKNIIVRRTRPSDTPLTSEHHVTVRGGKKAHFAATYGRFVELGTETEFGTVKMSPRPYLRPAFDQGKERAVDAIKNKLKERIDKARA